MDAAAEAQALDRLHEILVRPEFLAAPAQRNLLQVWSDAIQDWFYDLLVGLLSPVGETIQGQRTWVELVVVAVALLILLGVVWVIVRAAGLSVVGEARAREEESAARRERSDRLWRQAQDLAAEGKLVEAARATYLSALYALEEHAVLRVQEGLTNREHAARLAGEAGSVFGQLVQRYDQVRYGGASIDPAGYAELRGLAEHTRALSLPAPTGS